MELIERVQRDHTADIPDLHYRAYISHPTVDLGLIDAAGVTPSQALANVRRRFRMRWLGVEAFGMAVPEDARDPWCGQIATNGHRYALWRRIGLGERIINWIMLNPSTANADTDDATLRRVTAYSKSWGYDLLTVGNLWSYRATKPAALNKWIDAGGEWVVRNNAISDHRVAKMAERADLVVVTWGVRGRKDNRSQAMLRMLERLRIEPHALALTRSGEPAHPLRLPASLQPQPLTTLRQEAGHGPNQRR